MFYRNLQISATNHQLLVWLKSKLRTENEQEIICRALEGLQGEINEAEEIGGTTENDTVGKNGRSKTTTEK